MRDFIQAEGVEIVPADGDLHYFLGLSENGSL